MVVVFKSFIEESKLELEICTAKGKLHSHALCLW